MSDVKLMTLDPGHFHAALVQKEMHEGVSSRVHIYAPLGADLLAHLQRIAGFNARPVNPTAWELEVHTGRNSLTRLLRERPGNVVIISGRNRGKIDAIQAAVNAGLHVLADKPWVIVPEDLPKLKDVLETAERRGLIAYDIMTERYEITSILQRELVNDAETFGTIAPGSVDRPGVFMESVHYLLKRVAGVPIRRPAWFFDIHQQGEGLTDVGTHLVDLVPWILFSDQPIDPRRDVQVIAGQRWPTLLTPVDFQAVTGSADFPEFLSANIRADQLNYYCNNPVSYTVRGVHVKLNVLWDFQAAEEGAGDTHLAVFHGSRSRVEVRQGKEENYRPELYVVPEPPTARNEVRSALLRKVESLHRRFPGLSVSEGGERLRVDIPEEYRVGHEAHFGAVARQSLQYVQSPQTLPGWVKFNMQAKYFVTTSGVELARSTGDG